MQTPYRKPAHEKKLSRMLKLKFVIQPHAGCVIPKVEIKYLSRIF
jgi:hypothetical protein